MGSDVHCARLVYEEELRKLLNAVLGKK